MRGLGMRGLGTESTSRDQLHHICSCYVRITSDLNEATE